MDQKNDNASNVLSNEVPASLDTKYSFKTNSVEEAIKEKAIYKTARQLTDYGLVCVPVNKNSKGPKITGWQSIRETPLEQFNEVEFDKVGILCGEASRVICLDIDTVCGRANSVFEAIRAKFDLDALLDTTPCELTPSGGLHFWLKYDERLQKNRSNIGKIADQHGNKVDSHIDIKSNGGQAIVAPSVYWSDKPDKMKFVGKRYVWTVEFEETEGECLEAPEWLIDLVNDRPLVFNTETNEIDWAEPEPELEPELEVLDETVGHISKERVFTVDEIKTIVMNIDERHADDYSDWSKTLWALADYSEKHDLELIDIADEFSQRSIKYESTRAVVKVMNQHKKKSKETTIGTLIHWLKHENLPVYNQIFSRVVRSVTNRFDYSEKYCFADFQREFENKSFDSYSELKSAIENKISKVIACVCTGDGLYLKKLLDGNVDMTRKLGFCDFKMYYTKENKQIKMNVSEFIGLYLNKFSIMSCKLEHDDLDKNMFNLWSGFAAKQTERKDERLEIMLSFIKEIWASNDEIYYNYILSWLAGLVQNTKSINKTALVMISQPGCGKDTLVDFLELVLGRHAITRKTGISSIVQKHNKSLEAKRLVVINEMSSTREEFKSNFDRLKSFISDESIEIEPKGVNAYQINNIGNYLLFSNHPDSLCIERGDRRYAMFEMSNNKRNNLEYFTKLRNECFNSDVADAFYSYLMSFTMCNLFSIPVTQLQEEAKLISMSSVEKFLLEIKNGEVEFNEDQVSGADFYARYVLWCQQSNERAITTTKFGLISKQYITKIRSNGSYYVISSLNI